MKTCSVNIIARDAEKTIKACLDSLLDADCFSEIIIAFDTRTKDNTLDVLKAYQTPIPMKVFWHEWKDFSHARNAVLGQSKGSYIFWIDTDETLIGTLADILRNPQGKAYYLHQVSILPDNNTLDTPQVRLFPNLPGVRWELPIHEQISFSLNKLGIEIIDTNKQILHYGYDSEEVIRKKHIRNYPYLLGFLNEYQKNDDRRKYINDRIEESDAYFNLGNMGWVTILITIASIAIPLIQQGWGMKQAIDEASRQARLQKALNQAEIDQFAELMHQQFPQVSFEDWRNYTKLSMQSFVPSSNASNDPVNDSEEESNYTKYLPYAFIFLALMLVVRK